MKLSRVKSDFWFYLFLFPPAKVALLAWCYLCGVIPRSTWTVMGMMLCFLLYCLDTVQYTATDTVHTWRVSLLLKPTLEPYSTTVQVKLFHTDIYTQCCFTVNDHLLCFACQGFYCEHGQSDSCLQTRVSAGYVVSNKQPLEPQWLSLAL